MTPRIYHEGPYIAIRIYEAPAPGVVDKMVSQVFFNLGTDEDLAATFPLLELDKLRATYYPDEA